MINLGIEGLGHIGRIHHQASHKVENARVVAVATSRTEDARRQIHDVDFIYFRLGFPAWVSTVGIQSPSGSWDHVSTRLQYPGAIASVEASYLMPESWPFSCGFRVTGANGCLEFHFRVAGNIEQRQKAVGDFLMYGPGGAITRPEFQPCDMYASQLHYFVDCLERSQPPARCPPRHSLEVMRIMDACRRSADIGQAVKPEAADGSSGGHLPGV